MATKSKWHGNEIIFTDGIWVYSDGVPVSSEKNRKCGHCNSEFTTEGHDACLGTLIGVMNACCGHGVNSEASVQFLDGSMIHGEDAKTILDILKRYSVK